MELSKEELDQAKEATIEEVVQEYLPKGSKQEQTAFAHMLEKILNSFMKQERDIFLLKDGDNNKGNGFYQRTLSTALGKLGIEVPRDREGKFRAAILPGPWIRSTDSYEGLLSSLVINGFSPSNISLTLKELGLPYSQDEMTKIETELMNRLQEFRTRELPHDVFALYIDAYHTQIREKTGRVKKYCIYTVLGIDLDHAKKEVYGYYVYSGSESKQDWLKIFNDLISRGLKRALLVLSDDLAGLDQAIEAVFDKTDHQLCFIHLQRNIRRQMTKDDAKKFNESLSQIRLFSSDFEQANQKLSELLKDYEKRYPAFVSYLSKKQQKYLSFMKYPKEVRKFIYTTNPSESFNSLLEKIRLRLGGYFASEDILGVNLMLQFDRLARNKWKNPHNIIRSATYEIHQLFRLKFSVQE